jgi:hypothetical protein
MKNDRSRWVRQARELRAGGIELEIPEDDWRDPPETGLIIQQCGGQLVSFAFDIGRTTGFVVSLRVTIRTSNFALAQFGLEVPWEANLNLLEDPHTRSKKEYYEFRNRDEYPRDGVMNHFADIRCVRSRDTVIEGFLLASSSEPIPNRFEHGAKIPGFVNIFDQFGYCYPKHISLWADRSQKLSTRNREVMRRKPLFEKAKAINDG